MRIRGDSLISYPLRQVSNALFLKIQNNVKKRKDEKELRHLLGIGLMKIKDIKTFIPKYVGYRMS